MALQPPRKQQVVTHSPLWMAGPLRIGEFEVAQGFYCVHLLENGEGPCGGNVRNISDAHGTHSCVVYT